MKRSRTPRIPSQNHHDRARSGLRFVTAALALVGCISAGCDPTASQPSSSPQAEDPANRPPLKVVLVEADEIAPELDLRWQTSSEQTLQIISMSRQELETQDPTTIDVIVFPADLMGTLVERNWIAPVPSQVQDRMARDSRSEAEASGRETMPGPAWPVRWRAMGMFGGKLMAVPLGAPSMIAIARDLDCTPLTELHRRNASNQNSAEECEVLWEKFLTSAEKQLASSLSQRQMELEENLNGVTPANKKTLVSRYLWILASSESRYRGIFDLYKLQARLTQPEFTRSARYLHRLSLLDPATALASSTEAWETVASGEGHFAIGWPRSDNQQRLGGASLAASNRTLVPLVWNDGSGLMASMGRRTRQSASAAEFLIWLATEDQRLALQAKTERVELNEIDNDRNLIRDDYREYQTMQRLESGQLSMELTPRFAYSHRFMSLLADALVEVLRNPESTEEILSRCRQQADELAEKLGKEKLRFSLEASSGYAQ